MITLNHEKLKKAMKDKGLTAYGLSVELHKLTGKNTTPALVGRWLRGDGVPDFVNTMALMRLFEFKTAEDLADV